MADEIERLVLSPFREIVEKANTAVENAEAADDESSGPMRKAAQALAKEGERALKKIVPLCDKNYEEYAANFVDAMKEHEEITQFRTELEDLLWDFDDFVEVDQFDADKFDELQKASRRAAPKIVDILKRIKLVAPSAALSPLLAEALSSGRASIIVDSPSGSGREMQEVEQRLNEMSVMGSQAGPDLGVDGTLGSRNNSRAASRPLSELDRHSSHHSNRSSEPLGPPPRPPSTNPWRVDQPPPLNASSPGNGDASIERRPPVFLGDSPTLPPTVPLPSVPSSATSPTSPRRETQFLSADAWPQQAATVRSDSDSLNWRDRTSHARSRGDSLSNSSAHDSHRQTYSSFGSNELPRYSSQSYDSVPDTRSPLGSPHFGKPSPAIPEDSAVDNYTHRPGYNSGHPPVNYPPRQASLAANNAHPVRVPSMDSLNSSIFDVVAEYGSASPVASTQRTSSNMSTTPGSPYSAGGQRPLYSTPPPGYGSPLQSPVGIINNNSSATITTLHHARPHTSGGMNRPLPPTPQAFDDPGLIPVESETPETPQMPPRQSDCSIGPHSSFYQMKGFCKGAEAVLRGELGIKKIKRPVGGFSHTTVAKCTDCLYELDFATVEQDLNNDSKGNFTSGTVGFRLRILQKSHLPIRHIDEQLYGCVFCIHDGKTLDESDATVFFNQKQLFTHMARHPRPLPKIPSLAVVEGDEILPEAFRDNFDLHFAHPPLQSVMSGIAPEISRLPSAVATETRRNAHGIMRSPPDRAAVLQFAVGAKVVGIEFPAKYEGRWGIGWHDGVRAAFEAESVCLDAPPKSETRMQGTSSMQAVARWKWSQKAGDGTWLKFDKGDVIKNISWTYSDHWCWSGTSGKSWGIFPQSHLEPHSLKIVRPGEEASVSSNEKKPGALGLFSMKRNTEKKADKKSSSAATSDKKKRAKNIREENEPGRKLAASSVAITAEAW